MATRTQPARPPRTIIGNTVTEKPNVSQAAVHAKCESVNAGLQIYKDDAEMREQIISAQVDGEDVELDRESITLRLPPPAELPDGYVKRFPNVDCRLSESAYADAFQKLFYSLHQSNAQLASGKHIDNGADVIRYILEQYTLALSGS